MTRFCSDIYTFSVFVACSEEFDNCHTCDFLMKNDTNSLTCTECNLGYFTFDNGNCSGKERSQINMVIA